GLQWEWNYQSRAEKWSLHERSGFLRLHAFETLDRTDNLLRAGNTLTQRSLRTSRNVVTVQFDLRGLADGQHAGLAHFSYGRKSPAANSASLGAVQIGPQRRLEFSHDGATTLGPVLSTPALWVRSTWGLEGVSRFAYSTDGETFTDFGSPYQLAWGAYRGDRLGLFTYNNRAPAGVVDVDAFTYEHSGPHRP
ncbi:MAG TPA: hypothetical protein VEQ65_04770, partial [Opitutus sp.]|nr:hypothetical protein [Opitutus sp.]